MDEASHVLSGESTLVTVVVVLGATKRRGAHDLCPMIAMVRTAFETMKGELTQKHTSPLG